MQFTYSSPATDAESAVTMSDSTNKKSFICMPCDVIVAFVAGLNIFLPIMSLAVSLLIYSNYSGSEVDFLSSDAFLVFMSGATVAILQVTIAMGALILVLRCRRTKEFVDSKQIDDDDRTETSEKEIVFEDDDYCEVV